jgi:hypothetical protein
MNNCLKGLVFLTLISDRKHKKALLDALTETGGRLVNIMYGRGTGNPNYIKDTLGLAREDSKVIIICLIPGEKSDAALEMLNRRFSFDRPDTGIAFTIPVEKLSL